MGRANNWDGTDVWTVVPSDPAEPGSLPVEFPEGYLANERWVSSTDHDATIEAYPVPPGREAWHFRVHHAFMTLQLDADRTQGLHGILAGVFRADELMQTASVIATEAGFDPECINPPSCSVNVKDELRIVADLSYDGEQLPEGHCDAVSVGIAFEAVRASLAP